MCVPQCLNPYMFLIAADHACSETFLWAVNLVQMPLNSSMNDTDLTIPTLQLPKLFNIPLSGPTSCYSVSVEWWLYVSGISLMVWILFSRLWIKQLSLVWMQVEERFLSLGRCPGRKDAWASWIPSGFALGVLFLSALIGKKKKKNCPSTGSSQR